MGWRRRVRIPSPHRRPLRTRNIGAVPVVHCPLLVLRRFRFCHQDCVLCVGAAVDFPLHPDDLIRVDKSDYLASTFKAVVEHIHRIVLNRGHRRRYATRALGILLTLVEKTTFPLVYAAWINELLKSASGGDMDDEIFALFLRLSARRKEEDATPDAETPDGQDRVRVRGREMDPHPFGGAVASETYTPENALFGKILKNIKICVEKEGGWQDEAVYGGLIVIRDIPRLGSYLPEVGFLETLSDAMEETKPFRVRKAAYDVVSVARHGWLRSTELREKLMELDFPRRLHSVVIETRRSDHQLSFLKMTEILSEDKDWHSYLRGALDTWLPFRHEGSHQALRIFCNICELPLPEYDGSNIPLDKLLGKLVEDEWARVPGRHAKDLSAGLLQPLTEVTKQFKDLLFDEGDRRAVLHMVERVIPSLEKRCDEGYEGPGEDIHEIVNDLLKRLRMPVRSTTY
ncbi:hypothetical protein BDM02DRAFT_2540649 [Thelephora ganbajun]|uniref:Uncharacterized protein n=1 Tax=Thelephora ganbajun TaxID=370292 RepID=A0ACB6YXX1_THEGA|nr:hypothetical protein BDM02DRAFT_2540649 [Thelephora ganbajun]